MCQRRSQTELYKPQWYEHTVMPGGGGGEGCTGDAVGVGVGLGVVAGGLIKKIQKNKFKLTKSENFQWVRWRATILASDRARTRRSVTINRCDVVAPRVAWRTHDNLFDRRERLIKWFWSCSIQLYKWNDFQHNYRYNSHETYRQSYTDRGANAVRARFKHNVYHRTTGGIGHAWAGTQCVHTRRWFHLSVHLYRSKMKLKTSMNERNELVVRRMKLFYLNCKAVECTWYRLQCCKRPV